jgi:predicted nucleotide-binding protein
LEYIIGNAAYAFVVATPDDLGCLKKDVEKSERALLYGKESIKASDVSDFISKLNKRARENVVF